MKRLLASSLIGSSLLLGSNAVKADYDFIGLKRPSADDGSATAIELFTVDSKTGNSTSVTKKCFDREYYPHVGLWICGGSGFAVNQETGHFEVSVNDGTQSYNPTTNTWTLTTTSQATSNNSWKDSYTGTYQIPNVTKDASGLFRIGEGDKTVIKGNSDGSVQIGNDTNDIDISSEGLNIDGNPLITKKSNGEIHIGKNSLITTSEEETLSDGTKVQPLYAKDADGNKIPINIDGSKLLIDGVEVSTSGDSSQVTTNTSNISTNTSNISINTSNISTNTSNISTNTSNISTNTSNIKNLGQGVAGSTALTAALTALPQTSKESKLSCGVGSGGYSSRYAVGFGCASKVNERVDVNAGGSYVFGGSKSYGGGTLDSGVIKAGFVFKLGELKKPTQISMKEKEEFKKEISDLKENNKNIIAQNNALLERLERLEKVALGDLKSKDLAVYQLK